MSFVHNVRNAVSWALVATSCVGCSTLDFDLRKRIPWGEGAEGRLDPPLKIVAMWTDTVMSRGGAGATRGFGGRLMFYGEEGTKPIRVKGSLVVYAFDETGRDPENTRPDRKYVFTGEQFEAHYSKSALGHSYSVWIPWDPAGGPLREISLLVRFTPEKGPVVVGEASRQVLPGYSTNDPAQYAPPKSSTAAAAPSSSPLGAPTSNEPMSNGPTMNMPATNEGAAMQRYDAAVRPASYEAATTTSVAPPHDGSGRRMSTTTIALPDSNGTRGAPRSGLRPIGDVNGSQVSPPPNQVAPTSAYGIPPYGIPTNFGAGANSAAVAPAGALRVPIPVGSPAGTDSQPAALPSESPPSGRFGPRRHRPLGAPLARLERGHVPSPPTPTTPPSGLPSTPGSVPVFQSATISTAGPAGPR